MGLRPARHLATLLRARVLASLAIACGVALIPGAIMADTIWWTGMTSESWSDLTNWKIAFGDGSHAPGLPDASLPTYVSTSDMLVDEDVTLDDGSYNETKTLYVGGWPDEFDVEHGDPAGRSGILNLVAGEIFVADRPGGGSPPCFYPRVGMRGARGTVNQSGGRFRSCTTVSMGYDTPESVGVYVLTGGEAAVGGFTMGGQGTGILDMRGGQVVEPTLSTGFSNVGKGYHTSELGYQPGVGLFMQSGGLFEGQTIRIGSKVGSAGIETVRSGATVSAQQIEVGRAGHGAFVQTGGSVTAEEIVVGVFDSGQGQYTIRAGVLRQEGSSWFLNGGAEQLAAPGRGQFVVIGPQPDIELDRYYQNSQSRLVFVLEAGGGHVAPIRTIDRAHFVGGSVVDMQLADVPGGGFASVPAPEERLLLLTAPAGRISAVPALSSEDVSDWKLEMTPAGAEDHLTVLYCPGFAQDPSCDGL